MENMERREQAVKTGTRLTSKEGVKELDQYSVVINGVVKKYSEVTAEDQMAMKEEDFLVFFSMEGRQCKQRISTTSTIGVLSESTEGGVSC